MNVYAFYETIDEPWVNQEDQKKLIELWKISWSKYGWNPIILGLNDAKKHYLYDVYYKKIESLPTINDKKYEMLCFLRWLSFAEYGGWISAVSVMNYGFSPLEFSKEIVVANEYPFLTPTTAIHIPKEKLSLILDTIMRYDLRKEHVININGIYKPHVSDMIILNETFNKIFIDILLKKSVSYGPAENWQNSQIVHYPVPTIYMYGDRDKHKTRTQVILEDPRWKYIL